MALRAPTLLQEHFSQFGDLTDAIVMSDFATGRSRGFGFVTFRDAHCAVQAAENRHAPPRMLHTARRMGIWFVLGA